MAATTDVRTKVTIELEAACGYGSCAEMAWKFEKQLGVKNYSEGAAVMPVPESLEAWQADHRTARKRVARAERLGYRFERIDRSLYNDDLYEINTSLIFRQGRRMGDGYLKRYNHGKLPEYLCERHRVHTYGVLDQERLRAYMTLYRCGDLALVSMILGHGEHLRNDVMYLLFAGAVADQAHHGGFFYYNRWDSGLDGLRYFKSKLGLGPADIEWSL